MIGLLRSPKSHLRFSGATEGISYLLLLFVAMPLKYMAGMPEFVKVIGMTHGILFIWYILSIVWAKTQYRMSNAHTLLALIASVIPFGTFYADNKVFKLLSS